MMTDEITNCLCGKGPGHNRYMIFCNGCEVWLHASCVGISKAIRLPKEWFCPRCSASAASKELAVIKKDISTLKEEFHALKSDFDGMNSQNRLRSEEFQKEKFLNEVAEKERKINELENIITHYKEEELNLKTELANVNDLLNEYKDKEITLNEKWMKVVAEKDKMINDLQKTIANHKEEVNLKTELANVNDLLNDYKDKEITLNEKWMKVVAKKDKIINDLKKTIANHKEELSLKILPSDKRGHENLLNDTKLESKNQPQKYVKNILEKDIEISALQKTNLKLTEMTHVKALESGSCVGKGPKKRSLSLTKKNGSQQPLTPSTIDFDDFDKDV